MAEPRRDSRPMRSHHQPDGPLAQVMLAGSAKHPLPIPRAARGGMSGSAARDMRLLTLLIVLLVAIPSILIVGPLGAAGTPADLVGLFMLLTWTVRRISSPGELRTPSAVRTVALLFLLSIVVSYLAAATRAIDAIELSAADRGLLSTLAWSGMALFAMDTPRTFNQLDTVLRRLTIAGGFEAAVGLAQFVTHLPLVNYIQIPGLRPNADLASAVGSRGDLARPAGTAIHPIEFGAILTLILPIALHYALHDVHRTTVRRWAPVALIAFAIPISISRSAIVSLIVSLLILLPIWSRSLRRRAYAVMVVLVGCVYLTVPGLLGTLRGLFLGISTDTSAASRTDSYAIAEEFIARSPLFGRGYGTFLPKYRILDNQLLGTTIETGIVGLVVLLSLIVVPIVLCMRVRRATAEPRVRHLAQALAAAIAASGISFALYDALSFPTAAGMFFLVVGCAGALIRLHRNEQSSPA